MLFLSACQEVPTSAAQEKGKGPDKGKGSAAQPPREVRVIAAATEMLPRTVAATGTLAADEQVVLGTKVPGRLAEITVDFTLL